MLIIGWIICTVAEKTMRYRMTQSVPCSSALPYIQVYSRPYGGGSNSLIFNKLNMYIRFDYTIFSLSCRFADAKLVQAKRISKFAMTFNLTLPASYDKQQPAARAKA